jgi:hypothetical protein
MIFLRKRRSVVLTPYDGTPEGNFLGASMDDSQRQADEMMNSASSHDGNGNLAHAGMVDVLVFFLGGMIVLGMIAYGSAG